MVKIAPATKSSYPRLDAFARDNIAYIKKKDRHVYDTYIKWCKKGGKGWFNAEWALWYGWKPELWVIDRPKDDWGGFHHGMTDTIRISREVVKQFELDYANTDAQRFMQSTILHELVHWADWTADQQALPGEAGWGFEKDAYGKHVMPWF